MYALEGSGASMKAALAWAASITPAAATIINFALTIERARVY
jgi:hypothetical protein